MREPYDGREIWAELVEEHGELPPTHTEITPRGGCHILFAWDPARPVTNSPGALAGQNIDVRGQGGYVIMAPSVCVGDGKKNVAGQYRVTENFFQFAAAPDWLYDLVLASRHPNPIHRPNPIHSRSRNERRQQAVLAQRQQYRIPKPRRVGAGLVRQRRHVQQGTRAWRISSKALGRDNEEDLSIAPQGAKDWGVWDMGDTVAADAAQSIS